MAPTVWPSKVRPISWRNSDQTGRPIRASAEATSNSRTAARLT
jgi:hypothetical protein